MTDFSQNLIGLLGKRSDDPDVAKFLENADPNNAEGFVDEDGQLTWSSLAGGLVVYAESKTSRLTTVFFYGEGHEGYRQFQGPLPRGLRFSMTQAEVLATIPEKPNFSNAARDTWDRDGIRMVVRYGEKGDRIVLLTILVLP
jgi:hypothetical protein